MNDFIFSGSRDICISAHAVPLSALLDARSLKERLTGDPGSVWIICRHFVIQVTDSHLGIIEPWTEYRKLEE